MNLYRVEIKGDITDYANCFYDVYASNEKEAIKTWYKRDTRKIINLYFIKHFN